MKLSVLMLMIAGLVVVGSTPAFACSCMPSTPAQVAERNDAAFVGTYLGRTDPQPGPGFNTSTQVVNHFSVERVVKGGPIAGNVDVSASYSGASCGLELSVGQRVGLGLTGGAGEWKSNLCNQTDPDGLLAVVQPVNPPPRPPPTLSPKPPPIPKEQPSSPAATPTSSPSPEPAPSASPSPAAQPTNDETGPASDEGSGPPWVPVLVVAGLMVVAGGVALGFRRRGL